MQSTSLESKPKSRDVQKRRKSYIEGDEINENSTKSGIKERKKNKRKNKSVNEINIEDNRNNIGNVTFNNSKVTSAPGQKVNSITKTIKREGDLLESDVNDAATAKTSKRKKGIKSVSFTLDDIPDAKKSKPNTSEQPENTEGLKKKDKEKKRLKRAKIGKEKKLSSTNVNVDLDENKTSLQNQNVDRETTPTGIQVSMPKVKKNKSIKTAKTEKEKGGITETQIERDVKTKKRKKRQAKSHDGVEPTSKSKKIEKPDMIAESLENLNLGSNAHTLTDLIDQMTVADKKKKKLKGKKDKVMRDNLKKEDTNNSEEKKEKIKWVRKKWNKGRRDFVHTDRIQYSVIIENLPLSSMISYKTVLSEHFSSYGKIKQIGVAELYPGEKPKPIFNTTILFDTEEAVLKALEEDNTLLEGNRIRVRRLLPHSQTTIVVKTYAELTEQTLSTIFSSAGRIRKIKLLVTDKPVKTIAFIEFDSADPVERAIKAAEGVIINRKKVKVFKYQDEYGINKNN